MTTLIERTIHYTHRRSDFTQDIYVDGVWLASAKNWSQADTVELDGAADQQSCEGLDYPCDQSATHTIPLHIGRAIDGAPVTSVMHLCADCSARWQSWQASNPSTNPEPQPDAGAFGPQAPAWDINNSEYCPKHETWFGRMPCPECYTEARQPSADPPGGPDIPDEGPDPTPGGPLPPEWKTKEIPLSNGMVALVDDDMYDHLMQWEWRARAHRRTF